MQAGNEGNRAPRESPGRLAPSPTLDALVADPAHVKGLSPALGEHLLVELFGGSGSGRRQAS